MREAIRELQTRGLLKRRRGAGTIVCGRQDPTLFVQEIDTLGRLFDAAQDTRLERKSEGLIAVREELAALLGCKPGKAGYVLRVCDGMWSATSSCAGPKFSWRANTPMSAST